MQRWEYLECYLSPGHTPLNKFGKHGWELVAILLERDDRFPTAYFKRPLVAINPLDNAGKP